MRADVDSSAVSPSVARSGPQPVRCLLIAEAANPEWVSVPLEGWSHSRALAAVTSSHLVTQVRNRDALTRAGLSPRDFTAIDSERVAARMYKLATALRGGSGKGWTLVTAMGALSYYYFERLVWREFGGRIRSGEFDIVHRLTPLSPTVPSLLAAKCGRAGVPFVMGPLNGGVPWPRGFDSARRREKEWLSYVRSAYRLLPGYRSTLRHASAIITGSRDTLAQVPAAYREKCVYIPENAIDPARFERRTKAGPSRPLRAAFVGRLVPYKGADMAIEAAAGLIRGGKLLLDIIGDGPEMAALRGTVERERLGAGVTLGGWVEHAKLRARLAESDIFLFPSIREFGGAVVLEAMAAGLVPVVVDYGGPGELVTGATGFAVPIGTRSQIVAGLRGILERLVADDSVIPRMALQAQDRAFGLFTWDAKAAQVLRVYGWVLGRGPKPDFGMPLPDVELENAG